MMHKALEWLYSKEFRTIAGLIKALFAKYHDKCLIEGFDIQQVEEMFSFLQILLPTYVRKWEKRDSAFEWRSLEPVFDVRWNGFRLRGKCDGIYRAKSKKGKGKLWLFETKTASQLQEDTLLKRLQFDFQNLFYITAMSEHLGEQIVGAMYNVVKKPSLRMGKQDNNDWGTYVERVIADVEADTDKYFARFEVPYPAVKREQFAETLLDKLNMFSDWCAGNGDQVTYANESSCVARWPCSYLNACASGDFVSYEQRPHLFNELEDD